jgi:16S rRNA (guanine527-N7)-methyltransferase
LEIGSKAWKSSIVEGAGTLGITVTPQQAEAFARHAAELQHWNRRINLTAIKDAQEIALKHFVDSLAPANDLPPEASMLDMGSGGGFPGIPLKVIRPDLCLTLIDASRKKVTFLRYIIRILKLTQIQALHIRSDDLAVDPDHARAYEVIVCRAFASLPDFIAAAKPLLAERGILIALKGRWASQQEPWEGRGGEKDHWIDRDSGFLVRRRSYRLPRLGDHRTLVILKDTG